MADGSQNKPSSSPVLFNAQLWSNHTNTPNPTADPIPPPAPNTAVTNDPQTPRQSTPSPPDTPTSVSRRVSFQVDHSPFISVDPSAVSYDAFPGTSAISPASTASPLPYSPHASPATVPRSYFAAEPEATTSTGPAQMFDAFSWSAAITPHDYASAPQPYTPGHPANVAHREAMEREAYEGADPDMMDNGGAAPSRKGSGSSRRRGSDSSVAASSSAGAGTSSAHAKVVTHTVKPKSHARKMSAGHILRPRNAFIIFRSAMIKDGAITENMEVSVFCYGDCLVADPLFRS